MKSKNASYSRGFLIASITLLAISIFIIWHIESTLHSHQYGWPFVTALALSVLAILAGVIFLILALAFFVQSIKDRHMNRKIRKMDIRLQDQIDILKQRNFFVSQIIYSDPYMLIDDQHHCIAFYSDKSNGTAFYRYSDVISYEKIERIQRFGKYQRFSRSALYYNKCISLAIKINLRDIHNPCIYLNFTNSVYLEGSEQHNKAMMSLQEALSILEYIKAAG